MADKIRSLRLNITAGAVLVLLMGILFLFRPDEVVTTVSGLVGFVLLLIGVSMVIGRLFSPYSRASGMLVGALVAVVGGSIMIHPARAASIIPVMIAVVLIVHGFQNVSMALAGKKYGMISWFWHMVGGVLCILCGMACVFNAFGVVTFGVRIIGIMLIYDGLSSILTAGRVNRYEREYVDVDYKEL